MSNKVFAGVLIGIPSLRDDHEVMNASISLFRLRYLINEILMLNPMMHVLEKLIIQEIAL